MDSIVRLDNFLANKIENGDAIITIIPIEKLLEKNVKYYDETSTMFGSVIFNIKKYRKWGLSVPESRNLVETMCPLSKLVRKKSNLPATGD